MGTEKRRKETDFCLKNYGPGTLKYSSVFDLVPQADTNIPDGIALIFKRGKMAWQEETEAES